MGRKEYRPKQGSFHQWGAIFIRSVAVLNCTTINRHLAQEAGTLHVYAEKNVPLPFLGPWRKDTIIALGCAPEPKLGRNGEHSRIQPEVKRGELSDRCGHREKGLNLGEKTFPRHQVREQDTC